MRGDVVVRLVPAARAKQQAETVTALEGLLEEARAGRLIGFVAGLVHQPPAESTSVVVGAAWKYPTYCRGLVANLDDQLAAILAVKPVKR